MNAEIKYPSKVAYIKPVSSKIGVFYLIFAFFRGGNGLSKTENWLYFSFF